MTVSGSQVHHHTIDLLPGERLLEEHGLLDIPFEYPGRVIFIATDAPGMIGIVAQPRLTVGVPGFHAFDGRQAAVDIQLFVGRAGDARNMMPMAVPAGGCRSDGFMAFPTTGIEVDHGVARF